METQQQPSSSVYICRHESTPESLECVLQARGIRLHFHSLGATLTHLWLWNPHHQAWEDVVLGFDDVAEYGTESNTAYYGCTVGRVANRIAGAQFQLPNGLDESQVTYSLAKNNGEASLHGGGRGWGARAWQLSAVDPQSRRPSITWTRWSPHMEEGYPGTVLCSLTCRLLLLRHEERPGSAAVGFDWVYEARLIEDRSVGAGGRVPWTVCNLTQHTYFHLNAHRSPTVRDHRLQLRCRQVLEMGADGIPTGRVLDCDRVPALDFREAGKCIATHLDGPEVAPGYDHCYVHPMYRPAGSTLTSEGTEPGPVDGTVEACPISGLDPALALQEPIATLSCDASRLRMHMYTTEPGFQLYTANYCHWPADRPRPKAHHKGAPEPHGGICFEAQRFPDAIHQPAWRDMVLLGAGQVYRQQTRYVFEPY